jgi:hypothetical protein
LGRRARPKPPKALSLSPSRRICSSFSFFMKWKTAPISQRPSDAKRCARQRADQARASGRRAERIASRGA